MYKVTYGGKNGKTIQLVESPDMVAIRTTHNQELATIPVSAESRKLIQESTEVTAFPEAGVTIRRVTPASTESKVEKRDATRAVLTAEDNIRFAGRVLQDAKTGEVMVYTENFFIKMHDEATESACLALLEKYKLTVKSKLTFAANAYFVQATEGTGLKVFEIAHKILSEKSVEYCHPELVQERRFKNINPQQWHLAKTKIGDKIVDAHVNIETAWKITRGKGITIAVLDDGIDIDHPEFAGRIVHPFDATENNDNPRPKDKEDSHGTACAGMACAAGLADGASGTAPEAYLLPIRLRSGLGSMAEANAFVWAADKGADVISCSWGPSDGEWWNPSDPVHKRMTALPDSTRLAMQYALTKGRGGKGCVILFAAGNGNEDIKNDGYANYPGVLSVAACNDTSRRSVYSDFGEGICVSFPSGDFSWKAFKHPAPISDGLRTTDRVSKDGYTDSDYVDSFGGTSGACPGMAGVVALMLAANPALTPPEVKDLVRLSCQKIDEKNGEYNAEGHSLWYGYGRIDAGLAVANAQKQTVQPAAPTVAGTVRFNKMGDQPLAIGGKNTGNFAPPAKVLGFSLHLKSAPADLKLTYSVNVPTLGVITAKSSGEYLGANSGRQRIIGFAIKLEGKSAAKFSIEYSASLAGSTKRIAAKNGAWCGTDRKTGKTMEGIAVILRKAAE